MVDITRQIDLGGQDILCRSINVGVANSDAGPYTIVTGTPAGSTLSINANTQASDYAKQINLDTATGSVVTLPASTGSGLKYRFVVTVLATSNSHIIKVANTSDAMQGMILSTLSGTPTTNNVWPAVAGTSDTITLNRTTTGSVTKGEWIEIYDIALNVWQVWGVTTQSGTGATPFSATV